MKPLRLSVEAYSDDQIRPVGIPVGIPQVSNSQQLLESALNTALRPKDAPLVNARSATMGSVFDTSQGASTSLQDLCTIPNLCQHIGQQASNANPPCCVGYLQKSKTFKHIIYAPSQSSIDQSGVKTLEEALSAFKAQSTKISLPDKLNLSKSLAQAVLRPLADARMEKPRRRVLRHQGPFPRSTPITFSENQRSHIIDLEPSTTHNDTQ